MPAPKWRAAMKQSGRLEIHQTLAALAVGFVMITPVTHGQSQGTDEVVAVGDTISVTVYGEPDLNVVEAKVKRRGVVAVP